MGNYRFGREQRRLQIGGGGSLIWYCGQHRLGRFYADARRVETIETEALRDAE
jgi:hypothetical protein